MCIRDSYNLIFIPRNSNNILMKSVSFYLERFQRYGVLRNVQLFWATLYIYHTKYISCITHITASLSLNLVIQNSGKKQEKLQQPGGNFGNWAGGLASTAGLNCFTLVSFPWIFSPSLPTVDPAIDTYAHYKILMTFVARKTTCRHVIH